MMAWKYADHVRIGKELLLANKVVHFNMYFNLVKCKQLYARPDHYYFFPGLQQVKGDFIP